MATGLDAMAWPVLTKRLTIRRAVEADLEPTWRFRRDHRVTHWMTAAPSTVEAYRKRFADPHRLARTLVVELDGVIIGDLMLAVEDGWAQVEVAEHARGVQAELGWCIAPEHQGRGYASEAVEALLRICFEDLGLRRVTAHSFAANEASWLLMEKVGMRQEIYTVRESLHRTGEWLDGVGYALLADEWRARESSGR
jgi:RimJ/RimL family protein N-acetyltransferase